jgi:hypothetical protein
MGYFDSKYGAQSGSFEKGNDLFELHMGQGICERAT